MSPATETHVSISFRSPSHHAEDHKRLRHAREQNTGFDVGRYLQPPPMLFTRDGHNVFLGDMYRGHTAFLLCGGPSLLSHDLVNLHQRGILTCAINNAATVFRPNLWVSIDDPSHFCDAIWYDPGITKYVPLCHMEKKFVVRDEQDGFVSPKHVVGDMPGVFGYRRNETFNAEQWLYEDTFNWGSHSKRVDAYGNKGSRSVFYVAIRLLFYLGIRRVYLLGCDFRMESGKQNYAFEQDRSAGSVRGNNSSYRILNDRLKHLVPHFEKEGYHVFNCTPNSGLTVFPHVPYEEALSAACEIMPKKINTAGMYDRAQREKGNKKKHKESKKRPPVVKEKKPSPSPQDANAMPPTVMDFKDYPETTLVVGIDEESAKIWRHTWPTWVRYKPWLQDLPLIVIHDRDLDLKRLGLQFLQEHPRLHCSTYKADTAITSRERLLSALVTVPANLVTTPWYLKLDPRAIACANGPLLEPNWFHASEEDGLPALVASAWGYSKPANTVSQLDEWGDRVPALRQHPRLDLPFDPGDSRIKHPTIASWCVYANTEWTRTIARFTPERLPVPSYAAYMHFCAKRQGNTVRRVKMKEFGWDHSFRDESWFAEKCKDLLDIPG